VSDEPTDTYFHTDGRQRTDRYNPRRLTTTADIVFREGVILSPKKRIARLAAQESRNNPNNICRLPEAGVAGDFQKRIQCVRVQSLSVRNGLLRFNFSSTLNRGQPHRIFQCWLSSRSCQNPTKCLVKLSFSFLSGRRALARRSIFAFSFYFSISTQKDESREKKAWDNIDLVRP